MIRSLLKKIIHKIRKKENLEKNFVEPHVDIRFKIGDMVRFNGYALEKQRQNEALYGKCNNENCKCERIFEQSFIGLVTEVGEYYTEVFWPENFKAKVNIDDLELVNLEKI